MSSSPPLKSFFSIAPAPPPELLLPIDGSMVAFLLSEPRGVLPSSQWAARDLTDGDAKP